MKKMFCHKILFTFMAAILIAVGSASAEPWKFGVMSDTQWIGTDDGRNPGSCAVDIVKVLNQQFIQHGVKLVVQVGDLVDQTGSTATSVANSEDVRAAFAQELYNAGIAFFPFRGNHDSQPLAGTEFKRIYPQTLSGIMNDTPGDVFAVPNPDAAVQPFPTVKGKHFYVGTNFSTPSPSTTNNLDWTGLSYAFDFDNVRFVMLDQFSPPNVSTNANPQASAIDYQQSWINGVLGSKPASHHAFVFSHKGLITENHVDVLFGSDPSKDPAGQNAFFSSLYNNGVRYYMNGHDHMHDRSRIESPDGHSYVNQLLCASDSSKFYTPGMPANDVLYDTPTRQTQISQELHTVGYYIFTVDGPRVTADYYSAPVPTAAPGGCAANSPNCEYLITTTPPLNFVKAETFGYSLNGHEYLVAQDQDYTGVHETFESTTAKILGGKNGSTATDFDGRAFTKAVDTGWVDIDGWFAKYPAKIWNPDLDLASDIFTLWGMADLGASHTDTYALSLTYDNHRLLPIQIGEGLLGLVARDGKGHWVNAVDLNSGGTKEFVLGPYKSTYGLGTYGLDLRTRTVWAVINHNGEFAAAGFRHLGE